MYIGIGTIVVIVIIVLVILMLRRLCQPDPSDSVNLCFLWSYLFSDDCRRNSLGFGCWVAVHVSAV